MQMDATCRAPYTKEFSAWGVDEGAIVLSKVENNVEKIGISVGGRVPSVVVWRGEERSEMREGVGWGVM